MPTKHLFTVNTYLSNKKMIIKYNDLYQINIYIFIVIKYLVVQQLFTKL